MSGKEGISVKEGAINFSRGGAVTKVATGSGIGRAAEEEEGEGIDRPGGKGRRALCGLGLDRACTVMGESE